MSLDAKEWCNSHSVQGYLIVITNVENTYTYTYWHRLFVDRISVNMNVTCHSATKIYEVKLGSHAVIKYTVTVNR